MGDLGGARLPGRTADTRDPRGEQVHTQIVRGPGSGSSLKMRIRILNPDVRKSTKSLEVNEKNTYFFNYFSDIQLYFDLSKVSNIFEVFS